MKLFSSLLILGAVFFADVLAVPSPCPLVGPAFPWPTPSSTNKRLDTARKKLSALLEPIFNAANGSTNSIAVQAFDTFNDSPLFQWSYTADNLDTNLGVSHVDQNSVFRVGSVSKLWAMYLFLAEAGMDTLSDPIVKYVPELQSAVPGDAINSVQWANVTVGELASHLAGVGRDWNPSMTQMGFPVLQPDEVPPCGNPVPCDRTQFFDGLLQRHPTFPISATPAYSNAAFQILGYALEAIKNDTFENLFESQLVGALNLSHTFYATPSPSLGVIPQGQGADFWKMDLGDENPAGGIYSSANDMAALGRAILNNTLTDPLTTRRWMKPHSHTSSLAYSVGAPWEIISFPVPRLIDLYTKSGDIGSYSSILALSPDHGVGFTILVAGTGGHAVVAMVADLVAQTILPALEYIAKDQARVRFAGTYSAPSGGVNSSISIATDFGPGLRVTNWTSNSTDMFQSLATLRGANDTSQITIRLYPTGLETPGNISFRALIPPDLGLTPIGPFTGSCITWVTVDSFIYGGVGLDEFVFALDDNLSATSVSPRVLRIDLQRQYRTSE
ncbi:unnamed protein product [Penicillium pancosmium]